MSNLSKALEEFPENQRLQEIATDADSYASLSAIANQEGGKLLVKLLMADMMSAIYDLESGYSKMPEMQMRATLATFKANHDIVRALLRADGQKDLAREALEQELKGLN